MSEWTLIQERYRNSLFPVYFIIEVMTREMGDLIGEPLHKGVLINRGPHVQYWLPTEHWDRLQQRALEAVQKNPKLIGTLVALLRKKSVKFLAQTKGIFHSDLGVKTNEALWKDYDFYCKSYKDIGLLGEPVAFCVKDSLAKLLEEYLRNRLKQKGLEKEFPHFFGALVSPAVASFASREEMDLLGIALRAKQKGPASVRAELETHVQEYFWLPYDYEGDIWDKAYFDSVLLEMQRKPMGELRRQFERLNNQFDELKQKQVMLSRQAGIDLRHRRLFQALCDASEAMDLKKEILTQSHWYKNPLMKEIAVRLDVPFNLTYFMTPAEVKAGLLDKKLEKDLIEQRSKFCVSICQNGKTTIEMGESAIEWEKKIVSRTHPLESKEIHGMCACPGSAIGRVRVLLHSSQIREMMEGEILVTQATTPDFVPAMKKARAIVTNEGGITCHAAIVSRELGIPCIVGTQNATKLLRTGDLVDVHAASGTVKKIGK